jgi:hypothetical protein
MTYVAEKTSELIYLEPEYLTPAQYTSVSELPAELKRKYDQLIKSIPLVGVVTPLIVIKSAKINPSTYSYDYQIFFNQQDYIYLAAKELKNPCPAVSFPASLPADQLVMIKDQLGL